MIAAVLDTTVILHLFRKYLPALKWLNTPQRYGCYLDHMVGRDGRGKQ